MNVAIIMPLAEQRGGSEQLLRMLMQQVQEAEGVSWRVIFFQSGSLRDEVEALGIPTHTVRTGRLRQVGRYLTAVQRLVALFRQYDTDLVFSWMGKAHSYGGPAARWAGLPALWYQHGTPKPCSPIDRLATLLPTRGILACSEAVARVQRDLWPKRAVRVVHPCVDLSRFAPDQLPAPRKVRKRLGLPEEGPLVGIVGRLQRWKGIHVFVDAMREVLREQPDAYGVVVGGQHDLEPGYADEVRSQVAAYGLEERILMPGFQSNVPEWMQAMDVVVHASDNEPFGIVIIEAMALGKPVVAGASGGPREIITEGKDGLLSPYGDAQTLAEKIIRYLREPSFAEQVGRRARQRAQDFAPEAYVQQFVESIHASTADAQ